MIWNTSLAKSFSSDQVLNKIKHYIDENLVPEMKAISPEVGFMANEFFISRDVWRYKTAAYESLKKFLPKVCRKSFILEQKAGTDFYK